MKLKILVSAPYMQPVIDRFRPFFDEHNIELVIPPVNERLSENELLKWIIDIDGVIAGDDRFTEQVLEAAPRLKVISKWGTGIDSFNLDACKRLGIEVRNTPNAFSEPVADSVMGYILCFARQIPWMDRNMKQGGWEKIPGRALRECTLGIIGVGNVGKAVVRRAVAFGMRVIGNDLLEMPAEFINQSGIQMVGKDDLLRKADFVSLNCDLNPTSFHLISKKEFSIMKPSAYIINLARGPIIDESELIHALKTKKIAGAALDVFETEPLPQESPLRNMDNVFLAPHNSNSSPETWERVHESTVRNLVDALEKKT
ncbi:phosphoglycerate dehydrogenase [Thermodesulfobacteriota bacterium]